MFLGFLGLHCFLFACGDVGADKLEGLAIDTAAQGSCIVRPRQNWRQELVALS